MQLFGHKAFAPRPGLLVAIALAALCQPLPAAETTSARALVQAAMDHWRGTSSYSELTMTIHRADWQRSMSMRAWSQGEKLSLVRVTEPARDAGNGTLLKDGEMWTFSPKINRIIRVPSSLMNQGWMGSDFSNKDISKSTDILDDYEHRLLEQAVVDGFEVFTVEAIPHEDAATVWGREVLKIRGDHVLLEEQYWDQDGRLVKVMETREVAEMGGRAVARVMRMGKTGKPDEWTEITVSSIRFDLRLPAGIFTLSGLRNPRP